MSGPTLVERLGRAGGAPPVVYMSGHHRGEVRAGALPGGWARFVEKPIDFDILSELLRSAASDQSPRSIA